jgi:hypothetical protein
MPCVQKSLMQLNSLPTQEAIWKSFEKLLNPRNGIDFNNTDKANRQKFVKLFRAFSMEINALVVKK